jgi:hypothetical protein
MLFPHLTNSQFEDSLPPRTTLNSLIRLDLIEVLLSLPLHLFYFSIAFGLLFLIALEGRFVLTFPGYVLGDSLKRVGGPYVDYALQNLADIGRSPTLLGVS